MMSMLNQAAVEALCSATYLENYLDCMENLPDDLQRVVTQLRELDAQTNDILKEIAHNQDVYVHQEDGMQKKKALIQIQRALIRTQEIGDEKLQLVALIIDHIENRTRQLEQDLENLDPGATLAPSRKHDEDLHPTHHPTTTKSTSTPKAAAKAVSVPHVTHTTTTTAAAVTTTTSTESVVTTTAAAAAAATTTTTVSTPQVQEVVVQPMEVKTENTGAVKVKRQRRQRTHAESTNKEEEKKEEEEKPKKKKKRKAKKEKNVENINPPIDPDEPTYCLCEQVSYGEMIGCDNDACQIEWFHFDCVGLTHKPKGKWFCPKCRGDKPNVKRPDLK